MLFLFIAALAIKLFSLQPLMVERYYSNGLYPAISAVQRVLFGWIPFSVGDLLYGVAGGWLIYRLVRLVRSVRQQKAGCIFWRNTAVNLTGILLAIYISFNLLWGLNYNRVGMDRQLGLDLFSYTTADLEEVTGVLAHQLNQLQPASLPGRAALEKKRNLFRGAIAAFGGLSATRPHFEYGFPSVKPSLYSYLGNYLGFTGYYNPFTGEAQVNTTTPVFVRPFTTCHEIGHQLGYAKESEANFAGYLSAAASTDTSFLYSVYFDMYAYAGRYLYYADSLALRRINSELGEGVKEDIQALRRFVRSHDNPIGTVIDKMYAQYLVANEQPSGRMSYNEVIGMLIAYYKKNGRI